jgi:hypothetical protein
VFSQAPLQASPDRCTINYSAECMHACEELHGMRLEKDTLLQQEECDPKYRNAYLLAFQRRMIRVLESWSAMLREGRVSKDRWSYFIQYHYEAVLNELVSAGFDSSGSVEDMTEILGRMGMADSNPPIPALPPQVRTILKRQYEAVEKDWDGKRGESKFKEMVNRDLSPTELNPYEMLYANLDKGFHKHVKKIWRMKGGLDKIYADINEFIFAVRRWVLIDHLLEQQTEAALLHIPDCYPGPTQTPSMGSIIKRTWTSKKNDFEVREAKKDQGSWLKVRRNMKKITRHAFGSPKEGRSTRVDKKDAFD